MHRTWALRVEGDETIPMVVSGDAPVPAEIDVTYNDPPPEVLYVKDGGSWVEASKAYKKVNGLWVEQRDLTAVFDPQVKYVKG